MLCRVMNKILFCLVLAGLLLAAACDASVNDDDVTVAVTSRASIDSAQVEANGVSATASLSADGRYVAFSSTATNLSGQAVTGAGDVFVRDLQSRTTELVSLNPSGAGGNAASSNPSISADGRYVVYQSLATDLVGGVDGNTAADIFLRDRTAGTTERITTISGNTVPNGGSTNPSLSADGSFIVFQSVASNLDGVTDSNSASDIFIWIRASGTIERVSLDSTGGVTDGGSFLASVSSNGRYVAFESAATDVVSNDLNGFKDVFIRDRTLGKNERISVANPIGDANEESGAPSITADGGKVAFESKATNLSTAGDSDVNGDFDVYVRDRGAISTRLVSRSTNGAQGFGPSRKPSISGGGTRIGYQSDAPNLVSGDTNAVGDVFVFDLSTLVTQRASVRTFGVQASDPQPSFGISLSSDGRFCAFVSNAETMVDGDTNGVPDVYVRGPLP